MAEVVCKTKWPRSFLVKDGKGRILRRYTHFIKQVAQSMVRKTTKYDDIEEGEKEEINEVKQKSDNTVNEKEYYTSRTGRR